MLKVKATRPVANMIQRFMVHGTITNFLARGCKRNISNKLKTRIIWMATKTPEQLPKRWREGELQGQGTSVSDHTSVSVWAKVDFVEDDRGGHRCWKQIIKNETGICQNAYWQAPKPVGDCPLNRWDKSGAFWQVTSSKMAHTKKRTLYLLWNAEEALWRSGAALLRLVQGVLNLCRVQCTLSRHSGANCAAQCQKVWSQLQQVMMMTQNQQLIKNPRMAKNKTLDYFEVAFYGPWSKSHWTFVERAETLFKPERDGAVCSDVNICWRLQQRTKSPWKQSRLEKSCAGVVPHFTGRGKKAVSWV